MPGLAGIGEPSSVGSRRRFSFFNFLVGTIVAGIIFWNFAFFENRTARPLMEIMQASFDTYGNQLGTRSAAQKKTTVAYAVTITKFASGKALPSNTLFDRAAVLHQSIKSAMKQSSRYDYHIYAFVHPDAIEVKPFMEQLGYRVQVRETPFNITNIQNENLIKAQSNSCCGEKVSAEYTVTFTSGEMMTEQIVRILLIFSYFLPTSLLLSEPIEDRSISNCIHIFYSTTRSWYT